jgi:hypothetical protein
MKYKKCRRCGADLIIGTNYTHSYQNKKNYICAPCDNIRRNHPEKFKLPTPSDVAFNKELKNIEKIKELEVNLQTKKVTHHCNKSVFQSSITTRNQIDIIKEMQSLVEMSKTCNSEELKNTIQNRIDKLYNIILVLEDMKKAI